MQCKAPAPQHRLDGNSSGGPGFGTTLLLVCFCGVMPVYLVGGALFLRRQRGATGWELIPNRGLWASLPGLVKDGVLFTAEKIRAARGYETL